ncbi:hypothetical protein AB0B63_27960 [Micromonospora sp. NPDC049081]|uniref:hypothetical protein n=1 Tax=Micromonospora sp. NPDC049081 TaxID=3155150 RepID=UPI0033ED78DF
MRENTPPYWRERRLVDLPGGPGGVRPPDQPLIRRPRRQPRHFAVHLGFVADGPEQARELAVAYAQALSLLRPELVLASAALSPAGSWRAAQRLFCHVVGPDGERCVDVAGHPGFHYAPGPGGLGWGEGDG